MAHFATASCYRSSLSRTINEKPFSPPLEGCQNTYASVKSESQTSSEIEFLLQWLNQQMNKLT
jgi:hypothetical protein